MCNDVSYIVNMERPSNGRRDKVIITTGLQAARHIIADKSQCSKACKYSTSRRHRKSLHIFISKTLTFQQNLETQNWAWSDLYRVPVYTDRQHTFSSFAEYFFGLFGCHLASPSQQLASRIAEVEGKRLHVDYEQFWSLHDLRSCPSVHVQSAVHVLHDPVAELIWPDHITEWLLPAVGEIPCDSYSDIRCCGLCICYCTWTWSLNWLASFCKCTYMYLFQSVMALYWTIIWVLWNYNNLNNHGCHVRCPWRSWRALLVTAFVSCVWNGPLCEGGTYSSQWVRSVSLRH